MKKRLNITFFVLILLMFFCCFQKDKDEQNIKITNVGWVYENVGEGFGDVTSGAISTNNPTIKRSASRSGNEAEIKNNKILILCDDAHNKFINDFCIFVIVKC